jgi:hypothetical protein
VSRGHRVADCPRSVVCGPEMGRGRPYGGGYYILSFMICCAGNFEKLDKILYIENKAAKLN